MQLWCHWDATGMPLGCKCGRSLIFILIATNMDFVVNTNPAIDIHVNRVPLGCHWGAIVPLGVHMGGVGMQLGCRGEILILILI